LPANILKLFIWAIVEIINKGDSRLIIR
jgi:hypothetical protein